MTGSLPISIRADFFDLHLLVDEELREYLKDTPHEITDMHGNTLSSARAAETDSAWMEVPVAGTNIAKLKAKSADLKSLANFLRYSFERSLGALVRKYESTRKEILSSDLEALLDISEEESLPFESQLLHFLKILRAHALVENASIFGIYDGYTLEGLAGLGSASGRTEGEDWRLSFSTVAGIAASTRKIYVSENPASDPNFQAKVKNPPRNLLCYPLLHGDTLVGVLNLSNKLGGQFTLEDQGIVRRFSLIATHILQKHYFKKRMQSFAKTSDHLGKYLSSKVVKNVKSAENLELGGVEKKVVVLFSDIRSFTTITEGIDAKTLVNLLNFYFEKMSVIIDKYEGTLDKIVGDLIMAVWNIPHDQPQPELLAMKTAIEMQKEMIRVVAPAWAKAGVQNVGMGIGVNSGMAVAGNLGSSRFMNYTVVGDTINAAQRLEAKARAGEIWMAEQLFTDVNGKIEKPQRKESDIKLKGKERAISAYVYKPLSL